MDDSIKLLVTIFGSLATVLLGLIANGVIKMNSKQATQATKLAVMDDKLDGVIARVNYLYDWRNEMQKEQIAGYLEEIKKLKGDLDV